MFKEFSRIISLSILACYLAVLMEWLFFITKPSFLNNLSAMEAFGVLLSTPLFLFAICVLPLFFSGFLLFVLHKSPLVRWIRLIPLLVPAFIMATIAFLLLENFTYTVFNFNVGTFHGIGRYFYAFLFIWFWAWSFRVSNRWVSSPLWATRGRIALLLPGVLVSLSLIVTATNYAQRKTVMKEAQSQKNDQLQNILILSTDGLDADHMSAYGYARNTTPYIKSLLPEMLVFENHFSNASGSTGSIGSLLSGKLPTSTRVIYPPDVFTGADAYEHLPGLLKKLGYHNADISLRYYTDPYDLNMREGFHWVNEREIDKVAGLIPFTTSIERAFLSETLFFEKTMTRISERLLHAFGMREMINPYTLVTRMDDAKNYFPDTIRIRQLINFMENSTEPFFVHVHLMGTHGLKFYPTRRYFSFGQKQETDWMVDFYDDTILDYDLYVRQVVNYLKYSGRLENTVLILTSDHGMEWKSCKRIPLIIRFPQQQYKGRDSRNVQTLDIAPTLLNYLGVDIPEWMEGHSLIASTNEDNGLHPIFSVNSGKLGPLINGWRKIEAKKPPFYSLGEVAVIVGQRWYNLELESMKFSMKDIEGHTNPVNEQLLPSPTDIRRLIINHLQGRGYDISSLESE